MEIDWYYKQDGCKTGLQPNEHEVVVKIPFCGTYGYLSDYLDGEMEREREYHEQEEDPREEIEYHFDLGQFCKDYVDWLSDSLGLKTMRFQEMTSPSYYNFETDKIWCIIDKSELWELLQKIKNHPDGSVYLQAEIGEATTSRDGYWAFYKPEDCEWEKPDDFDDTCAGLLGLIMNATCSVYMDEYKCHRGNDLLCSSVDIMECWPKFYDGEFWEYFTEQA